MSGVIYGHKMAELLRSKVSASAYYSEVQGIGRDTDQTFYYFTHRGVEISIRRTIGESLVRMYSINCQLEGAYKSIENTMNSLRNNQLHPLMVWSAATL